MKSLSKFSKLSLFALLFCSCAIGPDFETPEAPIPQGFARGRLVTDSPEPTLKDATQSSWWEGFKDEKLNELISKASSENLSIQTAMERIQEATYNTRGTYFGLFPQFTVGTQYVKNKTSSARFPGVATRGIQYEIYSINAQTTWEVDLWGKVRREIEGSQTVKDTTIFRLADLLRVLQAQVGTTYIELRGLQKKKEVVDQTINNQIEIFKLTEAKYNIGQSSPIDLERAKVQLETSKARAFETQGLIDSLTARLSTLTRDPINVVEEKMKANIELPNFKGPVVIGSPSELLRKRPDVRIAEEAAHLATTNVGVVWANFLPQVAFNGSISRDARDPADWKTDAAKAYNYGPSISWSILNIGTLINMLDASKSSAKASVLNYQSVVVQALEEVEVSLSNLSTELERSKHLENAVTSAKEAYRISELQYNEGILPYSDLLLVDQEKLQAEFDSIDSEIKVSGNYINLYKALGGAWKEEKAEDLELASEQMDSQVEHQK